MTNVITPERKKNRVPAHSPKGVATPVVCCSEREGLFSQQIPGVAGRDERKPRGRPA